MSYACILTLLLLGHQAYAAVTRSNELNIPTFSDRIAKVFGTKCLSNAGQLEYKELLDELSNAKKCLIFCFGPPLVGEQLTKRCDNHNENATQCLNTLVKNLEHCLEPKEKYLMRFILDVYNTSSEYFCAHIKTLSVAAALHEEIIKCITQFKETPEKNPHLLCYKNSTTIGDRPATNILTKQQVCNDISRIDSCYDKLLEEQCPKVKEYQKHFTRAGLKHCTDVLKSSKTSEDPTKPVKT